MADKRFGRYEVQAELGRGGMSVVYRARDPALERPVAVKVLHPHLADRDESRARFTREAKAVARLQHPNIVEVYDYAPSDSEQAYIVTEYIDGPTLRQFVDLHPIRHAEAAALLMVPVLEALQHAHAAGIVHRDVKPENIMLRPDGTPVLMDFGIAQMVDQETLTATGTMLGSPAHMAPEVVEGEDISARSDLFSLGTVLYWLVCGVLPFAGPSPAALFRRIAECRFDPVLTRRPQAGRAIARLIERCMARDPEDRPATAGAVAEALRGILDEAGLTESGAELVAFLKDPEIFQDRLPARLVPAYLALAERAWAERQTGRALDYLDRVLTLDEHQETARSLLRRIERGQRQGRAARLLAAAVLLGLMAGAAVLLVKRAGLFGPSLGGVVGGLLAVADRATPAAPVTAAPVTAAPVSAAPVTAAPESAPPPDAGVDPDAGRAPDARVRRPVIVRRPPARVDAAVPEVASRPISVPVGGELKATEVFVDGVSQGFIALLESRGGLALQTGRKYQVEFRNPACEVDAHPVAIAAEATRSPTVYHRCRWRPAYLRVASNVEAVVLRSDGTLLGHVNKDIRVPMTTQSHHLAITVSDATNRVRTATVSLTAGRQEQIRMEF